MTGPDYRSLYHNQVRVTDEVENLRRGLMNILVKRERRIKHLEESLRQSRQFGYILFITLALTVVFGALTLVPYFLEFYNV